MHRTTAEEIQLWLQEREAELDERRGKPRASEVNHARSIEVKDDSGAAVAAAAPTKNQSAQACGSGDVMEPAPESTPAPALTADTVTAEQLASGKLPGIEKIREEVINRFRKSALDRVKQQGRISARPIRIEPYPANGPLREKGRSRRAGTPRATHPDPTGSGLEGRHCVTQQANINAFDHRDHRDHGGVR
jgi:hypothetical protein